MTPLFEISAPPLVPVIGSASGFPVRRIFCVGRNYAAHAVEMGNEVDREAPWYFLKSAHSLCLSGANIPAALESTDFHYEMELVVALDAPVFRATSESAMESVFGYACGLDMTRRDLQQIGKDNRRPWDLGKDFDNAAPIGAITPREQFTPVDQAITLTVCGDMRQQGRLGEMVWSVAEIICHLSRFYHLEAGDLIYTGTPAGVGPVKPGDQLLGEIEGLEAITITIGDAA